MPPVLSASTPSRLVPGLLDQPVCCKTEPSFSYAVGLGTLHLISSHLAAPDLHIAYEPIPVLRSQIQPKLGRLVSPYPRVTPLPSHKPTHKGDAPVTVLVVVRCPQSANGNLSAQSLYV